MNKKQLIESISEKLDSSLSKTDIDAVLNAYMETVKDSLKGDDEVVLVGFGTFGSKIRPERTGRNPKTGEEMVLPAKKVPFFKIGKGLKDACEAS